MGQLCAYERKKKQARKTSKGSSTGFVIDIKKIGDFLATIASHKMYTLEKAVVWLKMSRSLLPADMSSGGEH